MRYLIILILLFISATAYADEFRVPMSVYPKQIQKQFADEGRKLDLSGNERTLESWGFIENKGTSFVIYTYRSATEEDMEIIMKIVMGGSSGQDNR